MTPSTYFDIFKTKPWLNESNFPVCTTMLMEEEVLLLKWIAKHCYSGEGLVLDCGCFLGGSSMSLAQGLKEGGHNNKLHSFDLFLAGPNEGKACPDMGFEEGKSFLPLFEQNIAPYKDLIEIHEGDITQSSIPSGNIEILFIDCAKDPKSNDFFISKLFPRLIPGKSLVIQQDYIFPALPWIHIAMEFFSEYFQIVTSLDTSSVVYECIRPIPVEIAAGGTWNRMSKNVKHILMQQAINRWQGHKRQWLIGAYASYNIDTDEWNATWHTDFKNWVYLWPAPTNPLYEYRKPKQIKEVYYGEVKRFKQSIVQHIIQYFSDILYKRKSIRSLLKQPLIRQTVDKILGVIRGQTQ